MANAFALPGGHIVVSTGLLQLAEMPEELLGVLAHEIAHVTLKHSFRKTVARAGPILVMRIFLGGSRGALGLLGGASALLVNESFSQEYELEADEQGWNYLVTARIDPSGMIRILQKLEREEETTSARSSLSQAFSTHPAMKKRIQRLESKARQLPRKARVEPP
jgi:beta-barrel assembly-enhancing protease